LQHDKTKRSIVFLCQRKHVNVCNCSDQSLADTSVFGWNHFSRQDGSFIYTLLVAAFVSEWRRDAQALTFLRKQLIDRQNPATLTVADIGYKESNGGNWTYSRKKITRLEEEWLETWLKGTVRKISQNNGGEVLLQRLISPDISRVQSNRKLPLVRLIGFLEKPYWTRWRLVWPDIWHR